VTGPEAGSVAGRAHERLIVAESLCKIRFRFRKEGDLRFVSHHDLMRLMERLCRRADLPLRQTSGFHPKPRIVFAHALALGIAAREEVVEIEFAQPVDPASALTRMNATAPPGLAFHQARPIPLGWTGQPWRLVYTGWWPDGPPPADLPQRLADLWQQPEWWVERVKGLPPPSSGAGGEERLDQFAGLLHVRPRGPAPGPVRRLNVKPWVHSLDLVEERLRLVLGATPAGSVRPDEVLKLTGLWDQFLDGVLLLERTSVVLVDEVSSVPAESCPLSSPPWEAVAAPPLCKGSS